MSLNTFSIFYYGYEITPDNNLLNFSEGGGELTAEIAIGSYTFTDFAEAIQTALNAEGALNYTVTANRTGRTLTIAASGTFSLLAATGSSITNSPWALMGFTADGTGTNTYTGTAAGSAYTPQFILQDHIPTANWQKAALSTVNKTASGRVEVIKFGDEEFLQCNFKYITALSQPTGPITSSGTGLTDFLTFIRFLITKAPLEYMADTATRSTFEKMILESTPDSKDGTGFKLKEMYDKGLPGYFESGPLIFRVVE